MTQRGWDVFEAGGIWEIERDDELALYEDDAEAEAACADAARAGDRYAIEALIACAFQDPEGWPAYLKEREQKQAAG